MNDSAKERIVVALDVSGEAEAVALVKQLKEHVGFFKIGLELLTSVGIGITAKVAGLGARVFLDAKFHDIPNTVAGAARAAARLKIRMFNVHCLGGREMMRSAAIAAREEALRVSTDRPLVLGVTILTSIDNTILNKELGIPGDIEMQVANLARLAEEAGLDGVISSPREIGAIRSVTSKQMIIVTPGVRPTWAAVNDQKRIMTPGEAIRKGASYVVIGRPITNPPPAVGGSVEAAKLIEDEIAMALSQGRA